MELTQFDQWGYGIIENLGYLGLFLVSLISNGTVIFPIPGFILVFIFGGIWNPLLVALFSAVGAALGEGIGYGIGRGGGYFLKKKQNRLFIIGKRWFDRGMGFPIIVFFAATPLPFDVVGLLGGTLNYNFKKFLLATLIGKTIFCLVLAFAGLYGKEWILSFF